MTSTRATAILLVVLTAVICAVIAYITLAWRDCNTHDGQLVRGVIGYQCVKTGR